MKNRWVWKMALCLAVAAPVAVPGVAAHAGARDTVQLEVPLDSNGGAHQETSLGDLVADAVRQTGGADIALVAADDIMEASFAAGSIAPERIVKALSYANDPSDTVVVVRLTGAQLRKVMEHSVFRAPQPFVGFFQVSGLRVHYNSSLPEGKRLTLLEADGSTVEDGHTYRIATTRPVADGSFGYFRFWSKSDVAEDTHTSIAASLTAYLAAHKTIHATTENRIATQ